ncbi:hypothetical protein G9A89_022688 [Geosiphon pyriformis]|nr:hypothetical protein G9A89_022688 [Geosiphon pyriformis]
MTITRTKNKKAAPDICPKISNKISTKGVFSVVEATRQNVLEVFLLLSNHNKLSLVATEAIFSSLTGFSSVKVLSKKHTWVKQSLVSAIVTPNSFVVPNEILDEIFIALSSTSSKMGQDQPLAVLSNMVSFGKSSLVLETKQSLSVGSPVFKNWANQMETELFPPLVSGAFFSGA